MTIQELARKARVTPRTIRYYVEQGVLPPPGRGRPADYTAEHVRRLALIRRLKEQYLPLEEIRDTMQRLTLDEVDELLARSKEMRGDSSKLESASDYIAGVLGQTAVREEMKRNAPPLPAAMPAPAFSPFYAQPAPANSPGRAKSSASSSTDDWHDPLPAQVEQISAWQRITVAPGIELHYALNDARISEIAARIIEAARDILASNPGDDTEETE